MRRRKEEGKGAVDLIIKSLFYGLIEIPKLCLKILKIEKFA